MRWAQRLNHHYYAILVDSFYQSYWEWRYFRYRQTDQYFEDLHDMLGCYCMGGEL